MNSRFQNPTRTKESENLHQHSNRLYFRPTRSRIPLLSSTRPDSLEDMKLDTPSPKEQKSQPITKSNIEKLNQHTTDQPTSNEKPLKTEIDSEADHEMTYTESDHAETGRSAYEEYFLRIKREGEEYREKLRRGVGSSSDLKEPVWDEELEEAFQEAIRNIPIIGKLKVMLNGKKHGRNELISDYIYRVTGRWRSRKQVMSHIQVLKNICSDDPEFIKHVTNSKPAKRNESSTRSAKEYSKSAKVTKRPYRKNIIKQNQSRSPSPFAQIHDRFTPMSGYQHYSPTPYYGSTPEPSWQETIKTEYHPLGYEEEHSQQQKWVSVPEILYQQPPTCSESFYPYGINTMSHHNWSVTSEPAFQQPPVDPAMRTAIDPALTNAIDPELSYLPSSYDFSGSSQESETDDEGPYYATPNYPWDSFSSQG